MTGSLLQFLVALGGAIGIFLLGKLLIAGGHHVFEPALAWIRPVLVRVDHALAMPVARWIGLDETKAWRRWSRLLGVLMAFGLVGALAPWPLGVTALALGLVAVLAVFRRWGWDEEDRAMGLSAEDRRIPGGEDYSDEALAALAAMVMLSSLLVWRLTGAQAFEGPGTEGAPGYLLHILSEALVALPIVGNVDLLGYEDPSGVRVLQPNGGPVAFALRMAIDLVVIGGLLKAVDIARRIARGQDLRREEEALASRELARVLPSITHLRRLALGGDVQAMTLLSSAAAAPEAGQAPRARLCALHALRGVAAQHPEWASTILTANSLACAAVKDDPATAAAGLLGAAHVEQAEIALAESELGLNHVAAKLVGHAISNLSLAAIQTDGLTPTADAFLLDEPPPCTPLTRLWLLLRLAKQKLSFTGLLHEQSVAGMLEEALSHTHAALTQMPDEAPTSMRILAYQTHAEILGRLGQLDGGYEGSIRLTDALDAFGSAEGLLGEDDDLPRIGLWIGQGVTHEILGGRTQGPAALSHFTEAARLYESTAGLAGEIGSDIGDRTQCFINLSNACLSAAQAVGGDPQQTHQWLDRAEQACSNAARLVEAGHWPGLRVDAFKGFARAKEQRYLLTGAQEDIMAAVAARMTVLDHIDPRQAPLAWAMEAFMLSQAEHRYVRLSASTSIGNIALDRLRQARDLFAQAQDEAHVQLCDTLIGKLRADIAAQDGA